MLYVEGLTVRRRDRVVIDGVTFTARDGEVLAVIGPNGAGKTSLLEAIVGLVPTAAGALRLDAERLTSFRDRADVLAYMPDGASLPEEAAVSTGLGTTIPEDLARALAVEPLLARRGGELSRGEEKRVWLAWTFALGRPAVVLDEPFGAFDPVQLDGVLDVVRARARAGSVVVASIHQMDVAERIADRVVLLHEGRVVAQGTPAELGPLEAAFRAHVS